MDEFVWKEEGIPISFKVGSTAYARFEQMRFSLYLAKITDEVPSKARAMRIIMEKGMDVFDEIFIRMSCENKTYQEVTLASLDSAPTKEA